MSNPIESPAATSLAGGSSFRIARYGFSCCSSQTTKSDYTTEVINAEAFAAVYAFEPSFPGGALFAGLAKGADFE